MTKPFFKTIECSAEKMVGLQQVTVKSPALQARADVSFYLPPSAEKESDLPVVILLHGVYGSHWAWSLKGKVHETLESLIINKTSKPMLLVMPSDGLWGDGSGYIPHQVQDFEKWISTDLILLTKELFPQVSTKSAFFISGLSMGGYGAMRLGAKYPGIFSAFSAHSSVTAADQLNLFMEERLDLSRVENDEIDLIDVLLKNKNKLRPFRFDCGKKDPLFNFNKKLHKQLLENDIVHEFEFFEGAHEWSYWERNVAKSLTFFSSIT